VAPLRTRRLVTAARKVTTAPAWPREFQRAYEEGRFRRASEIYDSNAGPSERAETVLRASKAHMHADPSSALRLLINLHLPANRRMERVHRDALLTEAFARTRDFESADEHLQDALELARKLSDGDLLTMVGYRAVRRHLHAEDPSEARKYLDLTRSGKSTAARVYAAYAETLILPYEERVHEQSERLIELLRSLDPNRSEFVEIRAWSTHTLAALARELYIPPAIPEIDRQLSGIPWPDDFAANLFQALRGLGWAKALQGDYFNAFRHLKRASEVTDTTAWKVVAACDRSYLARSFGEHRWSRVELDEAEELGAQADWHATLAEERIGLLQLAELFGSLDTARSAMYLARYRELGEIKSPLYYRHDARRAAYAQYSTGVVELALGNKKRGLTELREARKVFERFGYDFRVARCLADEFKATGNADLLSPIEEKLRNYRQSWLVAELHATIGGTKSTTLPPMQQRVFDELCQGKATSEIARSLGRSEWTISNHIKEVFKAFGVKSRSALLAEAVRRGLVKTS
jgi:DNA-binding CsgD family transcriptional regulator/DNA-binding transcriptional ArsR family regulator